MIDYPYVLGVPDESSPTLADNANTYIMDSAIGDGDVGNERVLERAEHVGADVVVPSDVLHDPTVTTDRILELFTLLADRSYDPDVMIPIQPSGDDGVGTHTNHYTKLCDVLADYGIDIEDHRLCVGGISKWSTPDQVRALVNVRRVAGDDAYIHGLGFGATQRWITILRRQPSLVDSIDTSSIVQDVIGQSMLTPNLERIDWPRPRGSNSTVISVIQREYVLLMLSYYLGPDVREEDVPTTDLDDEIVRHLDTVRCGEVVA